MYSVRETEILSDRQTYFQQDIHTYGKFVYLCLFGMQKVVGLNPAASEIFSLNFNYYKKR